MEKAVISHSGDHSHDHGHGHEDHESINILGFWFFLISDMILFSCLFATYIVLRTHIDGGPSGKDLFDVSGFTWETFILLTSSFTSGLATLEMHKGNKGRLIAWLVVTALLGAAFVGLEVKEFVTYAMAGNTISRSAFLSAFFVLVGTHGAHVSVGLIWMTGIMIQLGRRGITSVTKRKVFIVGLYWHFLDIVWVFLFTIVYLTGVVM